MLRSAARIPQSCASSKRATPERSVLAKWSRLMDCDASLRASLHMKPGRGRIMGAGFAAETANLSGSRILQQAGTAMVARANALPQGVLALLFAKGYWIA